MIREEDDRQLTFIFPFGGRLKAENRWVKLSGVIPWDDLDQAVSIQKGKQAGVKNNDDKGAHQHRHPRKMQ